MSYVNQDKCIGCSIYIDSCPADTISRENGKATINQGKCTFYGKCFSACLQGAIRSNSKNPILRGSSRHPGNRFGSSIMKSLGSWRK